MNRNIKAILLMMALLYVLALLFLRLDAPHACYIYASFIIGSIVAYRTAVLEIQDRERG